MDAVQMSSERSKPFSENKSKTWAVPVPEEDPKPQRLFNQKAETIMAALHELKSSVDDLEVGFAPVLTPRKPNQPIGDCVGEDVSDGVLSEFDQFRNRVLAEIREVVARVESIYGRRAI